MSEEDQNPDLSLGAVLVLQGEEEYKAGAQKLEQ